MLEGDAKDSEGVGIFEARERTDGERARVTSRFSGQTA